MCIIYTDSLKYLRSTYFREIVDIVNNGYKKYWHEPLLSNQAFLLLGFIHVCISFS